MIVYIIFIIIYVDHFLINNKLYNLYKTKNLKNVYIIIIIFILFYYKIFACKLKTLNMKNRIRFYELIFFLIFFI
jgi:hypothetical protein